MKKTIKLLSLLMSLVMIVSSFAGLSVSAYAADYTQMATDLQLNGVWNGDQWLTSTKKESWYRFVVPADGKVTIKTMAYFGCCYTNVYSYDLTSEYLEQHIHGDETSPSTASDDRILSQGTYYIKVSGNTGKYKLFLSYTCYNTNDFGANSYDNPLYLSNDYMITGALTRTDREDWFVLYAPYSGKYNIRLTSRFRCCYIDLYDYDLTNNILNNDIHGDEFTPSTGTYNVVLSQGTYYIKISGDYGWYNLSWNPLTQDNCNHEFSALTVYPTYFAKGYIRHTCGVCGYTYKDNYSPKSKLSNPNISTYSSNAGKKTINLYYSSVYGAKGYEIQYSTSSKFTKKTTKTIKTSNTSKTIKKLKAKKKYYVRVRAYVKSGSKTAYSSWSSKVAFKTKK